MIEYNSLLVMLWLKLNLNCTCSLETSGVRVAELNGTKDESAPCGSRMNGLNSLCGNWNPENNVQGR